MQVRKFEAKTIKDAIELVKFHLGPDAIILSAKDNAKGFGLMGESSVEVTAAVSESKLRQKQLAEKKLNADSKKRYVGSTAKIQKEFIERSFAENREALPSFLNDGVEVANYSRPTPASAMPVENKQVQSEIKPMPKRNNITERRYIDIDEADQETEQIKPTEVKKAHQPVKEIRPQVIRVEPNLDQQRISALQNEIKSLQAMLAKFQKVPQNFLNLHPGAEDGLPYELSFVFKKLREAGLGHENIVEILKIANEILPSEQKKKRAFIDGWVIKYLLEHLDISENPFQKKLHVFVGPTGQGKTSTVVKMACHLLLKAKKRVALLSGDHMKLGATDQLKIYSQILNIPCGIISGPNDWANIDKLFERVDYVLLDTPGVNLRGTSDLDTIRNVLPIHFRDTAVHYVQSIMARDVDAFEIAERFRVIGFDDVIFTRLDEAVQHGMIYNFQKKFDVPIHSFGIGNVIPDDFELATRERVIDLIFGLTKIRKERGNQ